MIIRNDCEEQQDCTPNIYRSFKRRFPTNRKAAMTLSAMLVVLSILTAPVSAGSLVDSLRGGSLRVCTHNGNLQVQSKSRRRSLSDDACMEPLQFLEDVIEPSATPAPIITSTSRRTMPSAPSTVRTDVAILAKDFQDAIQAINQENKDIHVGRLLSACSRLEQTMRRIGFNQGAKDIGGNIRKIKNMYDKTPSSQRDSMPALLRYEIEMGVHDERDGTLRIKDPSAAVGFLWLGRTLNYQYSMFRLMLDENEEPYSAAKRAYDRDLKPHQTWAVQKVCQAAMTTLKPMKRTSVLSRFGGFEEDHFGHQESEATNRDLNELMDSWKPLLTRWKKVFSDMELESI